MSHCSRLLRLLGTKTLRLNDSKKKEKNAVILVGGWGVYGLNGGGYRLQGIWGGGCGVQGIGLDFLSFF